MPVHILSNPIQLYYTRFFALCQFRIHVLQGKIPESMGLKMGLPAKIVGGIVKNLLKIL